VSIDETKFVERLQFFNGQRLFAADLQGLESFNREMRWLHNQSLHQPGVGNGYAVSGQKGDREVSVGAGYGLDSLGRELVHTQTEILPVPPEAGDKGKPIYYDLTISYPDDDALEEAEEREGICSGTGVTRLEEKPVFCWVELAGDPLTPRKPKLRSDLQNGIKIRLARIAVLNCKLYQAVSIAERQSARPPVTPYIASGTDTLPGLKALAIKSVGAGENPFIITGTVDTRAAHFLTVPDYRAHIAGPREISIKASTTLNYILFDQFQVTDQQREQFDFVDMVLAMGPDLVLSTKDVSFTVNGTSGTRTRFEELRAKMFDTWRVVWMGVEG
jgi:hypothetical protein